MRILLSAMALAAAVSSAAQSLPQYPKDYFRNPLDIPIFLAGNFGECRPGHFHSGTDIKTSGKEGQPVHAAAAGYISRIKMEKGGFGHALYITHPNGYTTLYAHLSEFSPAIQKYVKQQQYERKRWDVDLQLSPGQFPVAKGQQIALSGNTGASTAPHLHFEIRDTKTEHPLNPQLFGLPVADKLPPVITELAVYDDNIYEGNKQTIGLALKEKEYKPIRTDKPFAIRKDTVQVSSGLIGIGIRADDYMEGSDNTITFLTARLYLDDSLQSVVTLNDIGYDESRYINAYTDYKSKQLDHKWIQLLFLMPGNRLDRIYSNLNTTKGRLNVAPGAIHKLSVVLTDDCGNSATSSFFIDPQPATIPKPPIAGCTPFAASKPNTYTAPNISFTLDDRQLYDDICCYTSATPDIKAWSDKFVLHYPYVPLHHYFDLQLKPNKPIPFVLRSKVIIRYTDGKDDDGRAAVFTDQGWYKTAVRNFGTYWLDIDTTAPVIRSLQKNNTSLAKARQLLFDVTDAATSVKTFNGYLDGQWICFEQHGSSFFYKFDEHCTRGKHELVFRATDENGNESKYTLTFTR